MQFAIIKYRLLQKYKLILPIQCTHFLTSIPSAVIYWLSWVLNALKECTFLILGGIYLFIYSIMALQQLIH